MGKVLGILFFGLAVGGAIMGFDRDSVLLWTLAANVWLAADWVVTKLAAH